MINLQSEINNIINLDNIHELNELVKKCLDNNEMNAVVYVYDYIKQQKYIPNDYTYELINKLHSKTILENSKLIIPDNGKKKLQARRRIHKIMKGYNYSNALKNKEVVILYLKNNEYIYNGKDTKQEKLLINELKKNCNLSVSDIRHILTYLKRIRFFV